MKKFNVGVILAMLILSTLAFIGGCERDAQVASRNISYAADNFEINRRVIFYNGITNDYMLSIEGLCSLDLDRTNVVCVTCKVGPGVFKKHYLGLSDNVTYFAEQLEPQPASVFRYKVMFKPSVIIPDVELSRR